MLGDKIEKARSVEYQPVPGAMLSPADAAIIGPAVEKIKCGDGKNRPKLSDVVDAARPKESPLHRFFEWDNGKAARKFRIEQARWLVRSVRVVVRYVSGATAERLLTQQVRIVEKSTGLLSPPALLEVKTSAVLEPKAVVQEEHQRVSRETPRLVSSSKAAVIPVSYAKRSTKVDSEELLPAASAENSKLLADAVRELLTWKRKYILLSGVTGLKNVFLAINELEG